MKLLKEIYLLLLSQRIYFFLCDTEKPFIFLYHNYSQTYIFQDQSKTSCWHILVTCCFCNFEAKNVTTNNFCISFLPPCGKICVFPMTTSTCYAQLCLPWIHGNPSFWIPVPHVPLYFSDVRFTT